MEFQWLAPPRIVFGWDRSSELGPRVAEWIAERHPDGAAPARAFLVCGSRTLRGAAVPAAAGTRSATAWSRLKESLSGSGVEPIELADVCEEPTVAAVDDAAGRLAEHGVRTGDVVIGIGGGSAIDLAKAVAAMAANGEPSPAGYSRPPSVREFLEGVGTGRQLARPALPVMAVPTTAGTGAEATRNAVIQADTSAGMPVKKSLRADSLMPRIALIDPALTVTNSPRLTAHAGMDALTQCLESLVSKRRQPMAALLAEEGAALALDALPRAAVEPHDRTAREAMALAALYSGMALANSGLGLAHGVAAALGARYPIAHGLACAVMLPAALAWNLPVAAGPLARLARRLQISDADDDGPASESFVSAVRAMAERLGIPSRLAELGVKREDLAQLAVASKGNSLDANPRAIGTPELTALLESLW